MTNLTYDLLLTLKTLSFATLGGLLGCLVFMFIRYIFKKDIQKDCLLKFMGDIIDMVENRAIKNYIIKGIIEDSIKKNIKE